MTYVDVDYQEVLSILQEKSDEEYLSSVINKIDKIMSSKYHNIKFKDLRYLGLLFECLDEDDLLKVMKIILAHINNPNIHLQEGNQKGKTLIRAAIDIKNTELIKLLLSNTHGSMINGFREPIIIDSKVEKLMKRETNSIDSSSEESSNEDKYTDVIKEKAKITVVEYDKNKYLYLEKAHNLILSNQNNKINCIGSLDNHNELKKELSESQIDFCRSNDIEIKIN